MSRSLFRSAGGSRASVGRWLAGLALCGALGCARPEPGEVQSPSQGAQGAGAGEGLVRAATRRPDAGVGSAQSVRPVDAGVPRLELEGVPRPERGEAAGCPPGEYRCCDGSCSPDRRCPGVACDPAPTMSE
jgi:hypothetical protein